MSAEQLYTEIYQQIDQCVSDQVDPSTRARLATLILGMIEAKSASPAHIAQAIHRLGLSDAQVDSIERRIRRTENDEEINDELCFHPFARHHLRWGNPKQMLLIVDPTTQDDRVVMVSIAVWYRGRALPIAWAIWPGNVPLVGDDFWTRIAKLLDLIAEIVPVGCQIIWLADRAFGTPVFTDLLTARGWSYVVRVQGQTRCRDQKGNVKQVQHLIHPNRRRGKMRGEAFKSRNWRQVSIVTFWGPRHASPLCLVSDLPPSWDLIRLYRRRYPIEATFRDYKSAGWQWEKGQVVDLDHLDRLLVGMAFASWFAILVGATVAEDFLSSAPSGKRRTVPWWGKRSLFAIGLHFLRRFMAGNGDISLDIPFSNWTMLNWQEQIYFHHARAFVFTL